MVQKNYNELYSEGIANLRANDLNKALNIFKKLNKEMPKEITILNLLAEIHIKKDLIIEAIKFLEKSIHIDSRQDSVLLNLGLLYFQLNQNDLAMQFISRAKLIDNKNTQIYLNLGIILLKINKIEPAIKEFEEGLLIEKNNFLLNFNLGLAYQKQGDDTQAETYLRKCQQIQPNSYDVCITLSNIYSDQNSYEKALVLCDEALKINKTADAFCNRGILNHYLENYAGALKDYDQSIQLQNGYVRALFNKSITFLKIKDFENGWDLYNSRWNTPSYKSIKESFPKNKKKWDGTKVNILFLISEQGIGDQILFSSYLDELKPYCKKLIIALDQRLINLYQRSYPDIEFISNNLKKYDFSFEAFLPLGDLCQIFRRTESSFKPKKTFLKANKNQVVDIKQQLNSLVNGNKKIICGLSWRSINTVYDKDKSLDLEFLIENIDFKNINFINLQYGNVVKEIKNIKKKYNLDIHQFESIDNFNDIDGLCSLIDACDLIISTSNVTVHLASALGKDVRLLLNKNSPWWWFINQTNSLWYESCTIYRNTDSWKKTFNQLNNDLKKLIKIHN
ncbi:MAG: tetratricopeptide repeat protein [Proteobacteria bacterium]|nr:tetratricopeptide repeat protein [Pseudomonadota bacterium]